MELTISLVRRPFDLAERALGMVFPAQWNPLLNLGALGFFFYWVITASGIYVYIFFDTGIHEAYESIEYMTHDQWYAAGVMRSLHRYASDGLIVVMLLHLLREFGMGRFRGARWFSWVTGLVVMVLIYVAGISGYWLVWDLRAQAITETLVDLVSPPFSSLEVAAAVPGDSGWVPLFVIRGRSAASR